MVPKIAGRKKIGDTRWNGLAGVLTLILILILRLILMIILVLMVIVIAGWPTSEPAIQSASQLSQPAR